MILYINKLQVIESGGNTMDLLIPLHTIIMFVGPIGCGKTTFAHEILLPALIAEDPLRGVTIKTAYLSDKELADDTFFPTLDALSSFPTNTEFIVLDTSGLDASFRKNVNTIAQKNAYKVVTIVFDYSNREDYYVEPVLKATALQQIKQFQQNVLPVFKKEHYAQVFRLKQKDFLTNKYKYRIEMKNLALYMSCHLPLDEHNIYIGDIHECLEEFISLLELLGAKIVNGRITLHNLPPNTKFVLLGDYVDKGNATKEIIPFIFENRKMFHILVGNHENFSYKYVHGSIDKKTLDYKKIRKYFTSIPALQNDMPLLTMFTTLFHDALPFIKKIGDSPRNTLYATHAPCQQKYIGKLHAAARRNQRNFHLNRDILIDPQLAFIVNEAHPDNPTHLFGHVMTKEHVHYYNKFAIDTGVVAGNKLTAVHFDGQLPIFTTVAALPKRVVDPLPQLFATLIPNK